MMPTPPPPLPTGLERLLLIGLPREAEEALQPVLAEYPVLTVSLPAWPPADALGPHGWALAAVPDGQGLRPPLPAPIPWVAWAAPDVDPLDLLRSGALEVIQAATELPAALARAQARAEAQARPPRPAEGAFDGLFPNLYDWIYVIGIGEDGTRTFETVNPPLHAGGGFLNPDFAGRGPDACLSPASAAVMKEHLDRVLSEGRPLQFEETHSVGAGMRDFQTILTPIRNKWGRIHRVAGVSRDITALKEAQAALRASEARLAHALEGTQQGLWDWNLATGEVYRSQRWGAMLGYAAGAIPPTLEAGLALVHPDDRLQVEGAIRSHLEGYRPRFQAEYRIRTASGEWVWIYDAGKVVDWDGSGAPRRVAGLCTDITERRRAEESLRALVGGVVHEMRNPVYGIVINLDALEATFGEDERFRPFVAALRESSERIASLMSDLRDYGEPRTLNPEPCSVRAVLEEAVASCADLTSGRGCTVHIALTEDDLVLPLHRRRIHQVFRNLLENALQHAPLASPITLSGHLEEEDGHAWWVLRVMDAGPGFAPEALARAFEPFFTRRKGGTGLGLSIVKRVVEEHGGRVEAANRPEGPGAVLTVRLPAPRHRLSLQEIAGA